jgi:hypothetical protein
MKNPETVRALLQVSEQLGWIRFRESPTQRDINSHFLHMGLYATAFLFPFIAG